MIKSMPVGVISLNQDFDIKLYNKISLEIFDVEDLESLQKDLRLLTYVPDKRLYDSENTIVFYDITDFICKRGKSVNFGLVNCGSKVIKLKGA